jgi:hypothetical protein
MERRLHFNTAKAQGAAAVPGMLIRVSLIILVSALALPACRAAIIKELPEAPAAVGVAVFPPLLLSPVKAEVTSQARLFMGPVEAGEE